MSGFDGPRRMSVPDMHGQHYETGYVQSSSFHLDASRRMSVPNLHHHNEVGSSYGASTYRPSPSYPNQPATSEPSLVYGSSDDESSSPTSSAAGVKAQLAPQGSGADLMEYYANLDREAFQTPCQLLDSLLKTGSSGSGHSQVDPVPVESAREEKKQTETSRQARLRYMSESVGFQPTDPDTLSCHEKKRNYIECLENYVGWLRAQCEIANVDAGDIERIQSYKGLGTRSVRTMIVHMQKGLRTDHSDILREEGDFLHLRERVMAQEAEQADAASRARRGF
ncbi:hypothetical protein PENSPDRAFT_684700 [Peniophora sp. CONT]|nr:hypothetical protein PENSPDRAFT_684700 [Peniophora sp. CONT]